MIKQLVPEDVCLNCSGCCRFAEQQTVWQVHLLDTEIKTLAEEYPKKEFLVRGNKIKLAPSLKESILYCVFFDHSANKCRIYPRRPFECQLYPFVINKKDNKVFLAVDLNCPFAGDNFQTKHFQEYLDYLTGFFNSDATRQILKNNPRIIQTYPGVKDLAEIFIPRR